MLDDLLARVIEARDRMRARAGPTPVLLKIAPDLTLTELDDVVGVARARKVDGMIVGNTTIGAAAERCAIRRRRKSRADFRAGRCFALSTRMLAETYVRAEGAFPLIGVGGIDSGEAALAKIKAGASLVQLYSALVFRGLGLIGEIKAALLRRARSRHGERWPTWSARTPRRSPPSRGRAELTQRPFGALHEPHDQPDRDHDHGAEQEIAPQPAHRVEAHVPDRCGPAAGCSR